MKTEQLENVADVDMDLVVVDGRTVEALAPTYLQPEDILRRAGLGYQEGQTVYNHQHCDYSRCVR